MAEPGRPLDVGRITAALARHDVRYVVVGGIAAVLHGWPGATADFDALGSPEPDNLDRLAAALSELSATSVGWDGTPAGLSAHATWAFDTDAGPLDLLFVLEPRGTYEELRPAAEEVGAFGIVIPVISLDDLIVLKRELGRPKDLRVAVELAELARDGRRSQINGPNASGPG